MTGECLLSWAMLFAFSWPILPWSCDSSLDVYRAAPTAPTTFSFWLAWYKFFWFRAWVPLEGLTFLRRSCLRDSHRSSFWLSGLEWDATSSGWRTSKALQRYCSPSNHPMKLELRKCPQASLAAEVLYNSSIPIIKLSILCLYRRIFPQRWFSYTLMCLGAFVIAYSVASIFADVFQCVPTNSIWEREKAKFCINYPALIISTGVINVLTDIILLALPIPILWGLNMSLARKRLLTMLFLMGGLWVLDRLFANQSLILPNLVFALSASCGFFLLTESATLRILLVSWVNIWLVARWCELTLDVGDYVLPSTISTVEICVGIVSACLPTYRPLFRYVRPTKRGCDSVGKWKTADIYSLGQGSPDIPLRTITSSQKNHVSVQDDEEQLFRQGRNDIYV